ncbi:MAG: peptidylprolyl isomerase [Phycisphaerae bacterium]|nr:peptidylprolyl isomerase [Phycisphaerae bacterium]
MLAGCGSSGPQPLNPATFTQPTADTRVDQRRAALDDRPGQLLVGARPDQNPAPAPPVAPSLTTPDRPINQPLPKPDVNGVSDVVRENVQTPADAATQRSGKAQNGSAEPAAPLTGATPGEYMTLGAVVVQVNGNPIYANKVLREITPVLAARAKELDSTQFRSVVEDEVQKQVGVLIRTELEFAAAQRNLDSHDRELADQLTMQWREQQITQAGGSLENAKARARADGRDFDDLVQEQYRVEMRRIYFQKKEFPKVQITAQDMRDFYAKHQADLFSDRDQAKFRVIKITFAASGGQQQALDKINSIRDRINKGEDFAKVAAVTNDDPKLLASSGDVGYGDWVQRGAYASQPIEDAVWKLQPGQMTPVIELPNGYAIAKLEQKQVGGSHGFGQPEVQAMIRRALEAEQFNALRDKALANLRAEAIIFPDPPHYEPAVEMAMQMYPVWAKKK